MTTKPGSPVDVPHELILASAGSGKTYQLTNRFLKLVGLGVEPGRILALTFTRKAAGEFFVAILKKLVEASTSEEKARALAEELDLDGWGPEAFLGALRAVTSGMATLTLGTLDSFFARIVGEFAFELGAPPRFQILDESAAAEWSRRATLSLFGDERRDPEGRAAFLNSFQMATFGAERSTVSQLLDRVLLDYHEVYLAYPEERLWGHPQAIWGRETNPWMDAGVDWRCELDSLKRAVEEDGALKDKQRARLLRFVEELGAYGPGSRIVGDLKYVFEKVAPHVGSEGAPAPEIVLERTKWTAPEPIWRPMLRLIRWIVFQEVETRLQQARGIWRTLATYEKIYDAEARRRGAMRFADLPRLLCAAWGTNRDSWSADSWDVAYRLDARLDHWLLDEFQDTSRSQWGAIEPLVDEVVQDPEGRRSLFVVGDVKQSIYRWRGGEPRLFDELRRRYNQEGGGGLQERPLNDSWRSAPPVIEAVNRVFSDAIVDGPDGPLGRALVSWPRATHKSRRSALPGYACLLTPEEDQEGAEARWALVLRILRKVDPLKRGLSVAILVRRNASVHQLADFLRSEAPDIPIATDTEIMPLVDNPVGITMLALLKASAHPDDGMAWGTVSMSPLGSWLRRHNWDRARCAEAVAVSVKEEGFEAAVRQWIGRMEEESGPWDPFSMGRVRRFLEAAAGFDRSGQRSVDGFLRFAASHRRQDPSTERAAQILTIHKSKGLGFDMTILAELDGKTKVEGAGDLAVSRDERGGVRWILPMPPKAIVDLDPNLRRYREQESRERDAEALNLLYVAMTRAKQGLYLVADRRKKSNPGRTAGELLHSLLPDGRPCSLGEHSPGLGEGLYEVGDPLWYEQTAEASSPQAAAPETWSLSPSDIPFRRARAQPSGQKSSARSPRPRFGAAERSARAMGSWLHEGFSRVGWADEEVSTDFLAWRDAPCAIPSNDRVEGLRELDRVLSLDATRELLRRRSPGDALWRERRFEILEDERWVSGVFDRVQIHRLDDGHGLCARVIDLKTDDGVSTEEGLDAAVERHRAQMEFYARVLPRLLDRPLRRIESWLIFSKGPGPVEVRH